MSKCTIESWKMKDIYSALVNMAHNGKKIVIPRFQRGQRWSKEQESTFIDSLIKGYPVGTLLFYRTNEVYNGEATEIYTLVDGLQRSTAISRYMKEPMKYYKKENVPEELLTKVYDILGFTNQEKIIKDKIRDIYFNYIRNLGDFHGERSFDLAKKISTEIVSMKNQMQVVGELMEILPSYLSSCKKEYEAIADTEIPAVVYTGKEENLPNIFERINSKGTPLNAFEIYAASWPQKEKYIINNEGIIDFVLKKYDILNDDIYEVRGYDRSEISVQKKLTIFEYVFGFSKWLNHTFAMLSYEIKDKPDEISTIGFDLLDACLFDSKNIGELHKKLKELDINRLENCIVDCIKEVDSIIKPITTFKGNSRKDKPIIMVAKNQILAMIAFVFREKYNIDTLKKNQEEWQRKEKNLKKQLFLYFVYDIIRKEWFEGGGKIHTAINTNRYYEEISPNSWESALTSMFEDSLSKKETTSVRNPSPIDIIFLNAIYVNKFSALDHLSASHFDIEHIATKGLMKKLITACCPKGSLEGLPIGSIANLCYLPEYQNRAKGDKTFYQDDNYLKGLSITEIEEKYSFTEKADLEWADMDYELGAFEVLREFYIDFLSNHFSMMKDEFYKAMGIDASEISLEREFKSNKHATKPKIKKEISDTNAGKKQVEAYEKVKKQLESKNKEVYSYTSRNVISNNKVEYVMSYSKAYPQGKRNGYWFAYHPEKVGNVTSSYYVFTCNDDGISFALPRAFLEGIKGSLIPTIDGLKTYYHIKIFIDKKNSKKTLLLSKPSVREIDIVEYLI